MLRFGRMTLFPTERRLEMDGAPIRLGGRAMDLLIHLARRPGETVSHKDLVAHVWGGARVEESNLRYQIGSLRRALNRADPATTYIVSVPGRGYTLAAEVREVSQGVKDGTAWRAVGFRRDTGEIVGRSAEIAAAVSALRSHRIVTLVGTGGVGKTTIAVAAAQGVAGGPGLTKHFVDLSAVDDPRLVPVAVAAALGVTVRTHRWLSCPPARPTGSSSSCSTTANT